MSNMTNEKVLVTGAAGFIGQHLVKYLQRMGVDAMGLDIVPGPHIQADIMEPGAFDQIVRHHQPTVVVHLAAQVGRLFGEDDARHTVQSNAEMTTIVARVCGDRSVRLVYASTSEVYGDQAERVCFEGGRRVLPHNLYGVTKYWGEEVAALYACNMRAGLQVLRLSMPYGPGMSPGRGRAAIINMLWQANTSQLIPVHEGAERSWCWVGDTVHGIYLIIADGEVAYHPEAWSDGFGVYNVGRSDCPVLMEEVARYACVLAGADPEKLIVRIPRPAMQTIVKRLSNEKLRMLGWAPEVNLDSGMEAVFEEVKDFTVEGRRVPGWKQEKAATA